MCTLRSGDNTVHDAERPCCGGDPCVRRFEQEQRDAAERAAAEKREFLEKVGERFRKSDEAVKVKNAKRRARLFKRVSRRRAA